MTVVAGVVVTVVAAQHVAVSQWPVEHTTDPAFLFQPSGQVYVAQVGRGVVVTVVAGTGTGAAVSHGLHIDKSQIGRAHV